MFSEVSRRCEVLILGRYHLYEDGIKSYLKDVLFIV